MGAAATLRRFVERRSELAPASGPPCSSPVTGWDGRGSVRTKATTTNQMLSLTELIRSALQAATAASGKLEVIGFDASSMANLEVAHAAGAVAAQ